MREADGGDPDRSMELASPIAGAQGARGLRARAADAIKRPRVIFAIASVTVVLVAIAVVLAVFLSKRSGKGFACTSPLSIGGTAALQHKGLAVDDATFLGCPGKIPALWPNAEAPVASIRLFKAWDNSWSDDKRLDAWQAVVDFAKSNRVKVLIGAQITCSEAADDHDWANVLKLLQMLGSDHVMGVAIGNELELMQFKDKKSVPTSCVENIWEGGYLLRKFAERIRDLDGLRGFDDVPVTSAFGASIMAAQPFWNTSTAMVLDFFIKAIARWGSRWVYSLNVYPYFDPSNVIDPGSTHSCSQALGRSQCWSDPNSCLFPGIVKGMRERMKVVSPSNTVLWITETGWSSPVSKTLSDKPIYSCKEFSDEDALRGYYQGFLSWNMQIEGSQGPDHVFYFTVRDSTNFGEPEYFGLIGGCDATECKLQKGGGAPTPSPTPPAPPPTPPTPPPPTPPSPGPKPGPAACSAHENCKGLTGNCCPTDAGDMLGCCS